MFKFVSGVLVGWTAARSLPPKPKDASPLQPPTSEEWRALAGQIVQTLDHIKKTLDETQPED